MKIEIGKRSDGTYEARVECVADGQTVTHLSTHETAYDAAREAAAVLRAWSMTEGECPGLKGKKANSQLEALRKELAECNRLREAENRINAEQIARARTEETARKRCEECLDRLGTAGKLAVEKTAKGLSKEGNS